MGVFVFLALAVAFSSATADSAGIPDPKTALLDYIRLPDPAYSWRDTGARLTGVTNHIGWTGYVLNLTSQAWLTTRCRLPGNCCCMCCCAMLLGLC